MAQKAQAKALALAGALDDAGNVGHDERTVVAVADDAELRLHGGEGIIGDFGTCRRKRRQQCRLARVGEADKAYVGQQFELEDDALLHAGLAGLGIAGRAVGGTFEVPVAETAAAALQQRHLLAVVAHLAEVFARLGVEDDGAARNLNGDVLAVLAERASGAAALAVAGEYMAAELQRKQRPHVFVALEDDVAATAAVTAVGTSLRHIFGSVEMTRAGTALARAAQYLYIVYEVRICHNSVFCQLVMRLRRLITYRCRAGCCSGA